MNVLRSIARAIYSQCLKSHHAEINHKNNVCTESGSHYVSDLCHDIILFIYKKVYREL